MVTPSQVGGVQAEIDLDGNGTIDLDTERALLTKQPGGSYAGNFGPLAGQAGSRTIRSVAVDVNGLITEAETAITVNDVPVIVGPAAAMTYLPPTPLVSALAAR